MRRINTLCYFLLGSIAISMSGCTNAEKRDHQPNILLILVDDMGFSDIGCYGGEIQTPNLDKLASEGIRFNQFFNTSKCFPSRACLLTGMYAQKCGMSESNDSIKNAVTIGEVLKESGYRTLMVGKHHGQENMYYRGFNRYFGLRDGMCNYFNPGEPRAGELPPARKAYDWAYPREWCIDSITYSPYTPPEKDFYTTDYFTNYAINYLDEYENEDKPFFLYVAYNAPHDPLMAWPEDIQKYIGKYKHGYEQIRKKRYEKQLEIGLIDESFPLSEPTYEDWDALSEEEQLVRDSIMAVYAAMIDRVDQNIGRLIAKIDEQGELDNTLIMFMSDNGAQALADKKDWYFAQNKISDFSQPIGSMARFTSLNLSWANVSNTPFRFYKDYSHNGGIATPLIINWPSTIKEKNRVSRSRGHFVDILPTILDITGADYPREYNGQKILPYDGKSLLPEILDGKDLDNSRPLFFQWGPDQALMKDNWKIVRYNSGPWELYNMDNDKTETNNLVEQEQEVAKDLIKKHEQWMLEMSQYLYENE
jgi:arylsulfatase A-like enzyme